MKLFAKSLITAIVCVVLYLPLKLTMAFIATALVLTQAFAIFLFVGIVFYLVSEFMDSRW